MDQTGFRFSKIIVKSNFKVRTEEDDNGLICSRKKHTYKSLLRH